jgi:hypothetical protein
MSCAYLTLAYNADKLRKKYEQLFVEKLILEKLVNDVEESKLQSDDSVHRENFLKFISESRDWAFDYIEEFQEGLQNFVSSIEPEINYFKEYGDIMSMSPNYYSLKKIVDEYEKLKELLPKEEQ